VKSHLVPSQVALADPVGRGHATHDVVPQLLGLPLDTHAPLQLWVPAGHVPSQVAVSRMHTPRHSFLPIGHVPLQTPLVQEAVPPMGTAQGSQDMPQLATLTSLTHLPPHR
jgi:hypothetical protein